jgi:hypothetical protein
MGTSGASATTLPCATPPTGLQQILFILNNGRDLYTAAILPVNHPENSAVTFSLVVIIIVGLIGLLVEERLSFEAAVLPVRVREDR